jgi:hypothetical protein
MYFSVFLFCLSVVLFCEICVVCLLCLVVVLLPPAKNPFEVKINNDKKLLLSQISIVKELIIQNSSRHNYLIIITNIIFIITVTRRLRDSIFGYPTMSHM